MKTVKAWAVVSSSGQLRTNVGGMTLVYLSKRNAISRDKILGDRIVRVEIREVKRKRKESA